MCGDSGEEDSGDEGGCEGTAVRRGDSGDEGGCVGTGEEDEGGYEGTVVRRGGGRVTGQHDFHLLTISSCSVWPETAQTQT